MQDRAPIRLRKGLTFRCDCLNREMKVDCYSFGNESIKMSNHETSRWAGWDFYTYSVYGNLKNVPGIYIFSKRYGDNFYPVYIGKTRHLGIRVDFHRNNTPIIQIADHLHARVVDGDKERKKIEKHLISSYNPPWNDDHRTGPSKSPVANLVKDRWYEIRKVS